MCGKIPVFLICIAVADLASPASSQSYLPFMAQYKTTQVRTPPNGSPITDETTEVIAVDSKGRRMTAITKTPPTGVEPRTRFTIYDPVAHTHFSYMSPGTEATVSAIPIGGDFGCSYMVAGIEGPTVKHTDEDLGTATIQGLEARGRRFKTIELGKRDESPTLHNMVETWTAVDPALGGLLVRYVSDDRSSGAKTNKELVSFRQSEPAPFIFRLPSGYLIVNREVSPPDCPTLGDIEPLPPPAR